MKKFWIALLGAGLFATAVFADGDEVPVRMHELPDAARTLVDKYFRDIEVTSAMMESGIPSGVYITDSIADGPAYNVGIQNGDILTKFDDLEIQTIRDFQNRLEETKTGDTVKVTVKRKSIDEYKEIEYQVTIGAR